MPVSFITFGEKGAGQGKFSPKFLPILERVLADRGFPSTFCPPRNFCEIRINARRGLSFWRTAKNWL
jgi:hypothetical protein